MRVMEDEYVYDIVIKLNNVLCGINTTKTRIYNIMRSVGNDEVDASHALLRMVEDYHNLGESAKLMTKLIDMLEHPKENDK